MSVVSLRIFVQLCLINTPKQMTVEDCLTSITCYSHSFGLFWLVTAGALQGAPVPVCNMDSSELVSGEVRAVRW